MDADFDEGETSRMIRVIRRRSGVDAAPLAKLLCESRFREQVMNARLDLSNPDTLEAIKEGQAPIPGQVNKAPASPGVKKRRPLSLSLS